MTDHEFKILLKAACTDLWWSSESDYPVEVVWQPERAFSERTLSERALLETGAITPLTVAEFFSQQVTPKSWDTAEDKAQRAQMHQLKELLEINLTSPQIYRCGEVEVKVYILGRTAEGTLAGVSTTLIET